LRLLPLVVRLANCSAFIPLHALRMAEDNQRHIAKLRIGQTLAEVEHVMGKPPERREARVRFDGLSVEEWSYLTDYVRKMDTTITFVGGKVEEIHAAPWTLEKEKD